MKYLAIALAVVFGCTEVNASAQAMNCVEYVKYATGLNLMGNAYQWWYSAANVLERGYSPAPGAIMVFGRTGRMHVGHVAIVNEVRSSREILIDQANWHHGRVEHGTSVIDTSPANDWSSVQVAWEPKVYGGPFPITGFIYTQPHATEAVDREVVGHEQPDLIEASTGSGHVRIIRGMGAHHVVGGHLVLADTSHMKKPMFKLASASTHGSASAKAMPAVAKAVSKKAPAVAKPAVKVAAVTKTNVTAAAKTTKVAAHAGKHTDKVAKHVA